MRNHLKHFLLLAVLTICFTATAVAQGTVKGKVVDAENNEPLIGPLYRLAVRHWVL